MIKAPTGRASIYLSKYLQTNLDDLNKLMTAKGFSSFNSYNNHLLTTDLNTTFSKVMGQRDVAPNKKIDIYNDTSTIEKEKLNHHSDGEELDFYHLVDDLKDLIMRDMKRRGISI